MADCDRFLAECADGAYGKRPIGKDHLNRVRQRLVGVLHNEMRLGTIERNVADVVKMPKTTVQPKEQRALSSTELNHLMDTSDGYLHVLVDLCGRNALRPAEARALRWIDLDLRAEELDVNGQMNRLNQRGPVKRASNALRAIGIDSATVARLAAWKAERELSGPIDRTDFVAVAATGKPVGRELFADDMQDLCGRAGVEPRITPYELRHTAISHQADAGYSAWEIADWAGTSEAMITKRYRHRLRRVSTLRPAT